MTKKRYFFKGYKVPVYVKTGICQTQSEVFASKNATNADNKKSFKMSKARGRDCKMTECKKKQGEVFLSENRLLADTSKGADLMGVTAASGKTSDFSHSTSCEVKKDEPQKVEFENAL